MKAQTKYVVDVMKLNPVAVGPDTESGSAERLADNRRLHDLIVLDGYQLAGVVSRSDLGRARTVKDCMTRTPVTVDDQETVGAAAELMNRHSVGCLPVVDWSGNLRGMVTRKDLAELGAFGDTGPRRCKTCGSTQGLSTLGYCELCLLAPKPGGTGGDHLGQGEAA